MYNNKKIIIVLLLASILLSACEKKKEVKVIADTLKPTMQKQEESYTLANVQLGTYTQKFASPSCILVYQKDTYVLSDKQEAKLKNIFVYETKKVRKGDVLAALDIDISFIDIEEKQMSFERDKEKYKENKELKLANIDTMEYNLTNMQEGMEKEISYLQLKKAESQYKQYVYQMDRSIEDQEVAIKKMEEDNANNFIVAPFDGVIDKVARIYPGDTIKTGDAICHIVGSENVLVGVEDNGKLRYNMEVSVNSRNINEIIAFTGRVVSANDVVQDDKWSGTALIELDDPTKYEELFYASVTANTISVDNVPIVDTKGISTESSNSFVSLYQDGKVRKRYITLGRSNSEISWVLLGLQENQSVITVK